MNQHNAFDPYDGRDPRDIPTYGTLEAARYLWLPESTVQSWVHGYAYRAASALKRQDPVIPVDPVSGLLSFASLLELHVLAALRREHGVTLRNVRNARDYMQQKLGSAHPLIDEQMETDGTHLFVRRLGALINASKAGQMVWEEVISARLRRIKRNSEGLAVRLFPFTRKNMVERPDAPTLVSIDPRFVFGRPVLTGTRVPTEEIAERFWAGDSYESLVAEYGRSPEEIAEAIRYEWWRAAA